MARKSAHLLLGSILLLVVLGLVMLISIGPYTKDGITDPYHDVKSQSLYLVLGLAGMGVGAMVNYRKYERFAWILYFTAAALLVLCFVPGVGRELNGSRRWIGIGGLNFQPSELAKIAGIMAAAAWCNHHRDVRRSFTHGFAYPLVVISGLCLLIGTEVDLGNASLLALGTLAVLYAGGTRLRYLALLVLLGAIVLTLAVYYMPERMGRVTAIIDLEKHRAGDGLQQWLSLMALGSGGDAGLGLGNSRQKMWSLPYPNSDFIFPIIGEELGLGFALAVILCFVCITIAGITISIYAPERFGKLLGFGLVSLIVIQALIHLGVTTALLPNKGMPLPFVSAGGSNLVCLLLSAGIMLNIYRQGRYAALETAPVLGRVKLTPAL